MIPPSKMLRNLANSPSKHWGASRRHGDSCKVSLSLSLSWLVSFFLYFKNAFFFLVLSTQSRLAAVGAMRPSEIVVVRPSAAGAGRAAAPDKAGESEVACQGGFLIRRISSFERDFFLNQRLILPDRRASLRRGKALPRDVRVKSRSRRQAPSRAHVHAHAGDADGSWAKRGAGPRLAFSIASHTLLRHR